MLDLNTSLSSAQYVLNQGLNPLHKALNLNAESSFSLEINHSDCDEAGSTHGATDAPFAQKLKDMISAEHSSVTAATPSDLGLHVDCEASSRHNEPVLELNYLNPSSNLHTQRADYGDYMQSRDDYRALHGLNLHQVNDSRLGVHDYKLGLEGDASSNDGKALPLESTGSAISTNGIGEDKHSTSNLKDVLYPGMPCTRNISSACGDCNHSTTGAGAAHVCESSVEEDAEPGDHSATKQLFPLRPCGETGEAGPTSTVLTYGSIIKPIINTTFEQTHATASLSSNIHNSSSIINTSLEPVGASNMALRPPWLGYHFTSSPYMNIPSMGILNPITHGIQPVKKSRRGPRSRSSQYRGVTFYRRTGRWESHIWDCGKQVYLGGFDTAHAAARAYDRAAIRFRGLNADINFNLGDYESEISQMNNVSKEEFVHLLRRQSMGFSRGSSRFRGVTLHKCGRWEARMGQYLGKKAYDEAAIQCNGRDAVTNFDTRLYDTDLLKESVGDTTSAVQDDELELSLGTSLRHQQSPQNEEARSTITKFPRYNSSSSVTLQGPTMSGSPWVNQQGALNIMGQAGDGNRHVLEGSYNSSMPLYKHSFVDKQSLPFINESKIALEDGKRQYYTSQLLSANKTCLISEASSSSKLFKSATESTNVQQASPITHLEPPPLPPPPLAAGGWAWQMQQNVYSAAALSSAASTPVAARTPSLLQAAAASSGFSPQQKGFAFPQWLQKTGLSYVSTSNNPPAH